MYFFPKAVSNLPRGVLVRKPSWMRYGSTINSNIEESSPNLAAIESRPAGILLFWFRKDKYCLSNDPVPFHLCDKNLKHFLLNLQ